MKCIFKNLELSGRYYYKKLPLHAQYIYRGIYAKWSKGYSEVTLNIPGCGYEMEDGTRLLKIARYVVEENPQLFHIDSRKIECQRKGDNVTFMVDTIYTEEEYNDLYHRLYRRAKKLVEMVPEEYSHVDKLRFIHNLLADNIVYDWGDGSKKADREVHSIVGSLLNRSCVCDGYAKAYQLICEMCLLPCTIVHGDGGTKEDHGPHAWNLVWVDSKYYQVDVTWDRMQDDVRRDIYFLRGDAFMKKDHSWDTNDYHACKEDYPRNEKHIVSIHKLEEFIKNRVLKGKKHMMCSLEENVFDKEMIHTVIKNVLHSDVRNMLPQGLIWRYLDNIDYLIVTVKENET